MRAFPEWGHLVTKRWRSMKTAPRDKPILIILEEAAGTYVALVQWKQHPEGFVWNVIGASYDGQWHEKCALGWAPIELPPVPKKLLGAKS